MLNFAECERLVSTARDKRSKPVQNNTRIERRDEDTYALRLHATDIATFRRNGPTTVNSGGWRTVTTAERLRGFVFTQGQLSSDHGVWYVQATPDLNDPRPVWPRRTVLKPFHALDPGEEPVKPAEGCKAGTEEVVVERREKLAWDRELRDDDEILDERKGGLGYVMRDETIVTRYVEHRHETWSHVPIEFEHEGDERKREQCPHCELFDRQHTCWSEAMNGGGWGRNRTHGYKAMVEALERYGSEQAWQQAYIDDFREVRAARKAYREWEDRNRVLFEDGMEVTADGYAERPDLKAIAREQRKRKAIEKKKQRINKFVADYVHELVTNGLPMPSGGDCWYCAFLHAPQENGPHPGATSMGDAMPTLHEDGSVHNQPNHQHLEDHMHERYYVPSMAVNALREAGYQDAGIYMFLAMNPEQGRMGGPREGYGGVSEDVVTRDLRKYLYKRLIPEAFAAGKTVVTFS